MFKKLHRTRKVIFAGDELALTEARNSINSEFRHNIELTDPAEIDKVWK